MPPGVGKYDIAYILGGRTNRSLVHRLATGIGNSVRHRNSVLITPWTQDLKTISPAQLDFHKDFRVPGSEAVVSAYRDNLGPPRVILVKSALFDEGIFNRGLPLNQQFVRAYIFARCVVDILRSMEMPMPLVSCHGSETGLIPYLLKQDNASPQAKVMFTAHHEERTSTDEKGVEKTTYDLDFALFPSKLFRNIKALQAALEEGSDLFYEGQVSALKLGIYFSDMAMMLHSHLLYDLFSNDPTPTNFFRGMVESGRLTYLLGRDDADLNHAKKAKMIVDIESEAFNRIGPYMFSMETARKSLSEGANHLLIHTGQSVPGFQNDAGYLNFIKHSLLLRAGSAVSSRVSMHPVGEHGPHDSGSAVIHMLSEAAALRHSNPDVTRPVVHLNRDKERILISGSRISLSEIAARQSAFIFPQLPNGNVGWTLIHGNTTVFIPYGRLMAGSSLLRLSSGGLFIFGYPVDISSKSDEHLGIISKRWGFIFADNQSGEVFSIKENPSVEEIRRGVELAGGSVAYVNLSNYAVRDDARDMMLKLYHVGEDGFGESLSVEYALHFIRHILEPMVLTEESRMEWRARWVTEGRDKLNRRFTEHAWDILFDNAQKLRKRFGGIVMASGQGIFSDIRSAGNRDRLAERFDGKTGDALSRTIRMFFDVPEPVQPVIEAKEPPLPEPAAPAGEDHAASELIVTSVSDASVPAFSGPMRPLNAKGVELFQYLLDEMIGESRFSMVPKAVEQLKIKRGKGAEKLSEVQMRDIIRHFKRNVLRSLTKWEEKKLAADYLQSMPQSIFDSTPIDAIMGLFGIIEPASQKVFNSKKPHGETYEGDPSHPKFFVVVEDAETWPPEPEAKDLNAAPAIGRIALNLSGTLPADIQRSIKSGWIFSSLGCVIGVYQIDVDDLEMRKF